MSNTQYDYRLHVSSSCSGLLENITLRITSDGLLVVKADYTDDAGHVSDVSGRTGGYCLFSVKDGRNGGYDGRNGGYARCEIAVTGRGVSYMSHRTDNGFVAFYSTQKWRDSIKDDVVEIIDSRFTKQE